MRALRQTAALRLLVAAVVVWLAADALSHGVCAHDFAVYAHGTPAQLGGASHGGKETTDVDDLNHCSCHWQYLPAPAVMLVECGISVPVDGDVPAWMPQSVRRTLERPPQHA